MGALTGYAIDEREPGDPNNLVRHLLCFDVNTGEQLWQKSVPDSSEKDPFSTLGDCEDRIRIQFCGGCNQPRFPRSFDR